MRFLVYDRGNYLTEGVQFELAERGHSPVRTDLSSKSNLDYSFALISIPSNFHEEEFERKIRVVSRLEAAHPERPKYGIILIPEAVDEKSYYRWIGEQFATLDEMFSTADLSASEIAERIEELNSRFLRKVS